MSSTRPNKVDLSDFRFDSKLAIPHRIVELMRYLVKKYPGEVVEPRLCVKAYMGLTRVTSTDPQVELFTRRYLSQARRLLVEDGIHVLVFRGRGVRPTYSEDDVARNVAIRQIATAARANARASNTVKDIAISRLHDPFNRSIVQAAAKFLPKITAETGKMLESIKVENERAREAAKKPTEVEAEKLKVKKAG